MYGPGIEHGVLATFQSRFICDTRGAGAGQLTVRVRGPKGAFRVEMQRESQKDRTILCKVHPPIDPNKTFNLHVLVCVAVRPDGTRRLPCGSEMGGRAGTWFAVPCHDLRHAGGTAEIH